VQSIDSFTLELGASSEIALALSLSTMMFAVALGLKVEHFKFIQTQPRIYFAGVLGQVIGLPLLTLLLCFMVNPMPSVALGMILVACCPGGNVSNTFVLLSRGNTALSVSLTATSSLLAAFVTPLSVVFWCQLYPPTARLLNDINFDVLRFLLQTTALLFIPLALGMLTGNKLEHLAQRIQKPLVFISSSILLGIIIISNIHYIDAFIDAGIVLLVMLIIHNALAFLLGNGLARLVKTDLSKRIAMTYEIGIQNSGLAIVILLTQLGGLGGAAIVVGFWGTWHIIAGIILMLWYRYTQQVEKMTV